MTAIEHPAPAAPAASAARLAAEATTDGDRVRLYVWQVPVRIAHWLLVGSIVVLSVTGGYIADPFLIPPGGSVMTNVRFVHIIAAFVLLAAGAVRAVYLLAGNRFARWTAFIPLSRFQATELFRQAGYYGFVRREVPKVLGHNQLAATAYIALFALLLVETFTGFVLDGVLGAEPAASITAPVRNLVDLQWIRMIHHLAMWFILAIAAFHIYSCVLIDHLEHNGLLSSMFSGFKFPTREEVLESRDGGPELLAGDLADDLPEVEHGAGAGDEAETHR
ncbi:MAG: cytochrome b/b6 domain-containing protein [Chloroflexota bacterium]